MAATDAALRTHGYADLTMSDIAAEYEKSTAAIHYHYATKEDLFVAYLEYLLDQFRSEIQSIQATEPPARLQGILENLLSPTEEHHALLIAILEMWSQGPYNDRFGTQFQDHDQYAKSVLRTTIQDGIDEGAFRQVDAASVAHSLMTIVDGARVRAALYDDVEELRRARETAWSYLEAVLLTEDIPATEQS
jgi:AcrR family transcriptional regulator